MPDTAPDLAALIDMQIRQNGPMSIATYMGLCLTHPRHGYYKKPEPIGKNGDFITAPEISQMFGEMLGFFLINLWQQMEEPKAFTLLELGPGRGTLMSDILRVGAKAPGFIEALDLRLFDTDPALVAEQRTRLGAYKPHWIESFELPGDAPLLIVANEFFDAMPIRQFVRAKDGWHERLVGLTDGKRSFGLSPTPVPAAAMPAAIGEAKAGEVYEAGLAANQVMERLAKAVGRRGGALLAIDYGYAFTQTGETLQAVSRHAYADPLAKPGEVDLSAHVDFGLLSETAHNAGLRVHPVTEQGEFLRNLGIVERSAVLERSNPAAAKTVEAALARLIDPEQMGQLFKVFVAASPGLMPQGLAS